MNQRIPKPNEDEKIINKLNLATPELVFISIARAGRLTEGIIKTLIYNDVAFTRWSAIIKTNTVERTISVRTQFGFGR